MILKRPAGLLSAVILILSQHSGYPDQMEIPVTTLLRCMSYYVMTLAGESQSPHGYVGRTSDAREYFSRRSRDEGDAQIGLKLEMKVSYGTSEPALCHTRPCSDT